MRVKTISYAAWVTAVTGILAAISLLMLFMSVHHATRSVAGASNGTALGYHDGDI